MTATSRALPDDTVHRPLTQGARLVLFDLDHTLLSGDTDVLWCEYLVALGEVGDEVIARNADLERRYRAGSASAAEFSAFYAGLLSGRSAADWQPLRERFARDVVAPRLPASAFALVDGHRQRGEVTVLTTATNRHLAEPSAHALGFRHLIATELGTDAEGRFDGSTPGVLNMREGKVARLHEWLAGHGLTDADIAGALAVATFYSDSVNDLPLLRAVGRAVAVDPDDRLAEIAAAQGWPILRLAR